MKLNRLLQNAILNVLSNHYPNTIDMGTLKQRLPSSFSDCQHLVDGTVQYFVEHGLVEHQNTKCTPSSQQQGCFYKATAKGLDFLADDGGLSAILGTVTVKLHADTIRDVLEAKIMESDIPSEDKKHFVNTLKALPGEALKTFTNKLIEMACDNPQAVFASLIKLIS
ncbi:hypothetical protein [Chromobacterium sp. Panama]|uniref:hypothetical protein n=1 Tax=Chromobacterium sp. Panama TaxID=2161826 RepID=UPI0011B1F2A3|nr:hypothetical protein [Chromobacterium sp. Panama]